MTFSAVLAALAAPFKTLPQATAALEPAKATLDSVAALFAAAGLPLEQMLATGPDALKAHLASLDKSADVTRLTGELATVKQEHASSLTTINQHVASIEAFSSLFTAIGVTGVNASTSPTEAKAKFAAHVEKQTTLALAKTGHPPAHVPSSAEPTDGKPAADADIAKEYATLKGAARLDFYAKHEQALWRHARATPAA